MKQSKYKSMEYKFRDQRLYEDYYSLHSIGWEYWSASQKYYQDCGRATERGCIFQYTVSGEGILEYNRKKCRMRPGQAFLIERPGQYRYYTAPNASHWEIKFISLNIVSLNIWRDITEQYGHVIEVAENSGILQCWKKIYDLALNEQLNSFFLTSGYAYEFMMQVHETLNLESKKHFSSDVVQNCINLIQTEYKESLSLEYLATECGISASYLSRLFRQSLQISPIQYLIQYRIEKACSLLLRNNLRAEDVAHQVGFYDYNYFSRVFKRVTGLSPKEYRKKEFSNIVENQRISLEITPQENEEE